MKNLKNLKVGDVLELSKNDLIFVRACMEQATNLSRAAERLLSRSTEEIKIGWDNIYSKWPELTEFGLVIDNKENCIVLKIK